MKKSNERRLAAQTGHSGFWGRLMLSFRKDRQLWLLCIPIIAWALLFCYYPMYGMLMAFVDYVPGKALWECEFVGLKHFASFITNPNFFNLLRNTLVMSTLMLTIGFIAPIIFALLLTEIRHPGAKKVVQTCSYLPHFISWIVAGSMVYNLLSAEGVINKFLVNQGWIDQAIPFLTEGKYYWVIYLVVNIWKGIGWSAIIYLSAISGVDGSLYEAGSLDGLGHFGRVWHITIPSILPTIILLFIMSIGDILNAGFDYHLIIGNSSTMAYWDVLDTYTYRYGIQEGLYSMSVAVSLMKSVIGFALVLGANKLSKKFGDAALF